MGLPTGQQRALDEIEYELTGADPRLASMFSVFTRLTAAEAMPWIEQVRPRRVADRVAGYGARCARAAGHPAARVRALVLVPAALVAMLCTLMVGVALGGSAKATPTTAAASTGAPPRGKHSRPVKPAVPAEPCTPRFEVQPVC